MILHWQTIDDDDLVVGDKHALAAIYEVSVRTVERHCTPVAYMPKAGVPRGQSGLALYDALAAAAVLEAIAPRARAAGQTLRHRMERHYLT
jgi:hypothetical protein